MALVRAPSPQSAVALPSVAVVHSPTPSMVKTADSSNGEQKNALAACDRWCSTNSTRSGGRAAAASWERQEIPRMYTLILTASVVQTKVARLARKPFPRAGFFHLKRVGAERAGQSEGHYHGEIKDRQHDPRLEFG